MAKPRRYRIVSSALSHALSACGDGAVNLMEETILECKPREFACLNFVAGWSGQWLLFLSLFRPRVGGLQIGAHPTLGPPQPTTRRPTCLFSYTTLDGSQDLRGGPHLDAFVQWCFCAEKLHSRLGQDSEATLDSATVNLILSLGGP
jgi:hypothetical protein